MTLKDFDRENQLLFEENLYLMKRLDEKNKAIKEAIDYITYYLLYNNKYEDSQKQFKRLLKILERTDE